MAEGDETDYISRALAAWFRAGGREQPANTSVMEHSGLTYVVLRSARETTMAVYRVRPRGPLKRLKRPPRALAADWYRAER